MKKKFKKTKDLQLIKSKNSTKLINTRTQDIYDLSDAGILVIDLCDGTRNIGEILKDFNKSYSQTIVFGELKQFIKNLQKNGLVG